MVKIDKKPSTSCTISENLATNLRVRQDDKIKVVPLSSDDEGVLGERSADLLLLTHPPAAATAVTFAPVEDSWNNLVSGEGGDNISDEEVMERFVKPFLEERGAVLKKGHTLKLRDENGKLLEMIVTHMDLEGEEAGKENTCLF
jgi:monoamine oxidase